MKNELNMKKFIYIFTMLFAVVFSACNSEDLDYDIEYTPIHPIGGMYRVKIVDEAGAEVKLLDMNSRPSIDNNGKLSVIIEEGAIVGKIINAIDDIPNAPTTSES